MRTWGFECSAQVHSAALEDKMEKPEEERKRLGPGTCLELEDTSVIGILAR